MTAKTDVWYAETKHFNGTWVPSKYFGDRPSEKTASGKRELKNVKKLDDGLTELSVGELYEHFNGILESRAEFRSLRRQRILQSIQAQRNTGG
jgi:hypothetical protein